jgi:hypothetical protein
VILAELERRRHFLVARSAAQRGELYAALAPISRRVSAADRVISGLRGVLRWAVRLVPLYSLLRRM